MSAKLKQATILARFKRHMDETPGASLRQGDRCTAHELDGEYNFDTSGPAFTQGCGGETLVNLPVTGGDEFSSDRPAVVCVICDNGASGFPKYGAA